MNRIPLKRVKGLIALWSVIFAIGAYEVHNNMVEQACDNQFRAAIIARAKANDEADKASVAQRDALAAWIGEFSHPPAGVDVYGPERIAWVHEVSERALARFHALDKEAADSTKSRQPIPEITCGAG